MGDTSVVQVGIHLFCVDKSGLQGTLGIKYLARSGQNRKITKHSYVSPTMRGML